MLKRIYNYFFSNNIVDSSILEILPFTMLVGLIYFIVRFIILKISGKKRKPIWTEITYGLFAAYIFSLFALVWTPEPFWYELWHGMNFEGSRYLMFKGGYTFNLMVYYCLIENIDPSQRYMLIANIVLFIPLGFFLPILFRKIKWWAVILIGFGTTCIIEIVQPVFGRVGDLDDIITNTLGAIIGCIAAKLLILIVKLISKQIGR